MMLRFARPPKCYAQVAHASKRGLPAPKSIESNESSHPAFLRAGFRPDAAAASGA